MTTRLSSIVPQRVKSMPVRDYLRRAYPMLGAGRVTRLLGSRQCRLNSERAQADSNVKAGDEVTLYADFEYDLSLDTIFDDGKLIAFVKPSGLPVDVDSYGIGADTVLARLQIHQSTARLVHRLDTQTCGVMLAAFDEETESLCLNAFRKHLLQKTYYALCLGPFAEKTGAITSFISKDSEAARVSVSSDKHTDALEARSDYHVLKELNIQQNKLSLLEVNITTGRTHQIRAQLAHIGHPVLGDEKYGNYSVNKALALHQMCLASREIRFSDNKELGIYAGKTFVCPKEKIKWLNALT